MAWKDENCAHPVQWALTNKGKVKICLIFISFRWLLRLVTIRFTWVSAVNNLELYVFLSTMQWKPTPVKKNMFLSGSPFSCADFEQIFQNSIFNFANGYHWQRFRFKSWSLCGNHCGNWINTDGDHVLQKWKVLHFDRGFSHLSNKMIYKGALARLC